MTYQNVFREFREIYREKGITGYDYAVLYYLQLSANPKTGVHYTTAPLISSEIGIEVETVRTCQKRLKQLGLLLYRDSHHYRTRPYMLPGYILFKTSKEITIIRSSTDMLQQLKKQNIIPTGATKSCLCNFLHNCGENWTRYNSCFSKRLPSDFSIFDYFMSDTKTVSAGDDVKPKQLPEKNSVSIEKHDNNNAVDERAKAAENGLKNIERTLKGERKKQSNA